MLGGLGYHLVRRERAKGRDYTRALPRYFDSCPWLKPAWRAASEGGYEG